MSSMRWTPEQAEALVASGDLLLAANAGTGKTTTVVSKILWSLGFVVGEGPDGPLPPCPDPIGISEVVAITFTEKAAYDLERKLRSELEKRPEAKHLRWELDKAYVGTIHGYCARLLRDYALRLGIDPTFRVFDAQESRLHLENLLRDVFLEALENGEDGARTLARRYQLYGFRYSSGVLDLLREAVRDLRWHPGRLAGWMTDGQLDHPRLREGGPWSEEDEVGLELAAAAYELGGRALERWEAFLRDENARDFDALILNVRDMLLGEGAGPALREIRARTKLLIIDELQDTDFAQRDIAFAIAGDEPGMGPQLMLVGDPKQSIYRFRGADVSVWNAVEEQVRQRGQVLDLTMSFRSTPAVVDAVNRACRSALEAVAEVIEAEGLSSAVAYSELVGARGEDGDHACEYIPILAGGADEMRVAQGQMIGARIQELVDGGTTVTDPDSNEVRPCRYADFAVLYRASTGIGTVIRGLRSAGVPFRLAGTPRLEERLEVRDLVNLIRVLNDPGDDLSALGFLRSPFVGLRDDVIARMRLCGRRGPLLAQAERLSEEGEWSPSDLPALEAVERDAVTVGLDAIKDGRSRLGRRSLEEVVSGIVERTGYLHHLVLGSDVEERIANVRAFFQLLDGYGRLSPGEFLEIWDRFLGDDLGIPQGALHAADDDVVTLSTVHSAKGLEWPIVVLTKLNAKMSKAPSNQLVSDPTAGPVLLTRKDDHGARADGVIDRLRAEEIAEEARLLYVAMTRARDRLIVTGYENAADESWWSWLQPLVDEGLLVRREPAEPPTAEKHDASLDWLDRVADAELPELSQPLTSPALRRVTSATEMMTKEKDPERWARLYVHGVKEAWEFAAQLPGEGGGGIPADVRGTIIHNVLERIREEAELAELLDESIGSFDDPDLEASLGRGSEYRAMLELEIEGVIRSPEWAHYTAGAHWRELPFVHLASPEEWRVGAFDLYRPGPPNGLVVDFKTHPVKSEQEAENVAEGYAVQVDVYRAAAGLRGETEVRLEFTALSKSGRVAH